MPPPCTRGARASPLSGAVWGGSEPSQAYPGAAPPAHQLDHRQPMVCRPPHGLGQHGTGSRHSSTATVNGARSWRPMTTSTMTVSLEESTRSPTSGVSVAPTPPEPLAAGQNVSPSVAVGFLAE
jgi:hypothetical protein